MTSSLQLIVTGKVQGVFFRSYVHDQAKALGLKGWVRNLDDSKVEILAQGDDAALEDLKARVLKGTTMARVDSVTADTIDYEKAYDDFQIRG